MSGFRPRLEELADDALVVVRGGTLDVPTLRADAVKAKRRFGDYGVSVFGVPDRSALEELARVRLQRFEILTVTTAGAIRAAGLELRPTFRRPHYTVMLPDLDRDLARLVTCENEEWRNPHFIPPEGPA